MRPLVVGICFVIALASLAVWMQFLSHNFYAGEWLLAKAGIGWLWVSALCRLLTAIGFAVLMVPLLASTKATRIVALSGMIVMIIYTEYVLSTPFGRYYDNFYFTELFYNMPLRVMFYCFTFATGYATIAIGVSWIKIKKHPLTLFSLLLVVVFGMMFALKPMYVDDFERRESDPLVDASAQSNRIALQTSQDLPTYLFYFSTSCDHCYYMYHRLEASASRIPSTRQISLVIQGTPEQLLKFTDGEQVSFPYQLLADTTFYAEAGPRLPACYVMKGGKNISYWIGDQFNFARLKDLCQN